jgi:hypothetical protein
MGYADVLEELYEPTAQELLSSADHLRLAYMGSTASPGGAARVPFRRAAPHRAHAPELGEGAALTAQPRVALTVDTDAERPHALQVRGTSSIEVVNGVPDGFLAANPKAAVPEQWQAFETKQPGSPPDA